MSEETYRKLVVIFAGTFVFTFIVTCAIFLKIYDEQSANGRYKAVPRVVQSWTENYRVHDSKTNQEIWVPSPRKKRVHGAFDTRTGRFAP